MNEPREGPERKEPEGDQRVQLEAERRIRHQGRVGMEGEDEPVGSFEGDTDDLRLFANLVSVTFSAFDPFGPLPNRQDKSSGVQYACGFR